jgi:hypothetical protein
MPFPSIELSNQVRSAGLILEIVNQAMEWRVTLATLKG